MGLHRCYVCSKRIWFFPIRVVVKLPDIAAPGDAGGAVPDTEGNIVRVLFAKGEQEQQIITAAMPEAGDSGAAGLEEATQLPISLANVFYLWVHEGCLGKLKIDPLKFGE